MVALKYRTGNVSLSTCHDGGVSNLFDPQTHPRNGAQMSVGISIMPWLSSVLSMDSHEAAWSL